MQKTIDKRTLGMYNITKLVDNLIISQNREIKKGGIDMILGENVKKLRKKANMSQRELATKVFVSNTVISNIEQDKTPPSLQLAAYIANALGCTVDDLIKEE